MAQNTFNTTIQVSSSAIVGTAGKVAKVTKVGFPNPSMQAIEITNMDSAGGVAEYLPGKIIKYKPFNVELEVVPGDATDVALTTAATSGALQYIQVNSNGASATFKYNFQGVITDYSLADAPVDGIYTATLTIQPSGAVTRA